MARAFGSSSLALVRSAPSIVGEGEGKGKGKGKARLGGR